MTRIHPGFKQDGWHGSLHRRKKPIHVDDDEVDTTQPSEQTLQGQKRQLIMELQTSPPPPYTMLDPPRSFSMHQIHSKSLEGPTSPPPPAPVPQLPNQGGVIRPEVETPIRTPNSVLSPCKGRLKIAMSHNFAHVTVHILEACSLRSLCATTCNPYVKLALYPENSKRTVRFETEVYQDSINPNYDATFSFDLHQSDYNRRILLTVWSKTDTENYSEFLGCMSFGIKGFLTRKQISGYYYLLNEATGKKKHLKAGSDVPLASTTPGVIPETNQALSNMQVFEFTVARGSRGYGFTLSGSCPVYVGDVDEDSPSKTAGLKAGDFIVKIDGVNVSRSTTESVVKLFRMSNRSIHLIICRPMDPVLSRPLPPVPSSLSSSAGTDTAAVQPKSALRTQSHLTSGATNSTPGGSSVEMTQEMKAAARRSSDLTGVDIPNAYKCGASQIVVNNNNSDTIRIKRDPVSIDDLLTLSSRSTSPPGSNTIAKRDPSSTSSTVEIKSILRTGTNNPATSTAVNIDIHSRLQYLGHLKKVNFSRYSPRLEYSGTVNLIDAGTLLPADLFLFPDVLLIGQREPDGFVTIIKEPIYNSKITYINIPTCSQNELILQYINENGKKQFAHFQGPTVNDWLVRIQSHMLYNCHWWMNNIA